MAIQCPQTIPNGGSKFKPVNEGLYALLELLSRFIYPSIQILIAVITSTICHWHRAYGALAFLGIMDLCVLRHPSKWFGCRRLSLRRVSIAGSEGDECRLMSLEPVPWAGSFYSIIVMELQENGSMAEREPSTPTDSVTKLTSYIAFVWSRYCLLAVSCTSHHSWHLWNLFGNNLLATPTAC